MKKVFLHCTYDCNARCVHCAVPRRKSYLSLDLFKKMADSIPMEFLVIGGGEPLKHPNLEEMIDYARKKTKVKIETNGQLLNESFLDRNQSKLFQINVSIDGTEETHNSIRQIDTFQHTTKMVMYARSIGIDVAIWSVIMKPNISEIEKIVALTRDLGADKLSFLYATPAGRCCKDLTVPYEQYNDVIKKVTETEDPRLQIRIAPYVLHKGSSLAKESGCLINDEEILHIDPSGDIYPCVLLLDNPKYKLGSIQGGYQQTRINDTSICLGLIESIGEDPRKDFGIPVCPCRTISKEWKF